jgi:hypothetical protein
MKRVPVFAASFGAFVVLYVVSFSALISGVPSGTWARAPEGEMSVARAGASAVQLADGRILITGGRGGDPETPDILRTAEVFGENGTFVPASPMVEPRAGHASVLLQDGRVLVTGGVTAGGADTSTAEIYDPSSNDWSEPGAMLEARSGHTMSRLADGRVLIAGGQSENGALTSVEIYTDGVLTPAGELSVARAGLSAATLLGGGVVFAGGHNADGDLGSLEVYDPASGTISLSSAILSLSRSGHQAFLLPNNNVLIVGGTSNGSTLSSAELYAAWNASVRATSSMANARAAAIGSALYRRTAC